MGGNIDDFGHHQNFVYSSFNSFNSPTESIFLFLPVPPLSLTPNFLFPDPSPCPLLIIDKSLI